MKGWATVFDERAAAVLRERLAISQLLDVSPTVSLMQRASFRLQLLRILDDFDKSEQDPGEVLHRLTDLHGQVLERVAAA
jgi:hypothetical protein